LTPLLALLLAPLLAPLMAPLLAPLRAAADAAAGAVAGAVAGNTASATAGDAAGAAAGAAASAAADSSADPCADAVEMAGAADATGAVYAYDADDPSHALRAHEASNVPMTLMMLVVLLGLMIRFLCASHSALFSLLGLEHSDSQRRQRRTCLGVG
jgi:hypothetical protein